MVHRSGRFCFSQSLFCLLATYIMYVRVCKRHRSIAAQTDGWRSGVDFPSSSRSALLDAFRAAYRIPAHRHHLSS
uniref:Secreted protein n=1 Tax=Steinernema glaseri TaxID=37863 RepID=A0A1I8AWI8_9BILA